jgi:hypothetical protein
MRAQLSLEFLIVILSAIALLSIMLPQIQKTKDISNYALLSRNAQLILDKLYYSCERVHISGENETITVNSLSNYSIQNMSDRLIAKFGSANVSRAGFRCSLNLNISKGATNVTLSPGP